MRACLREKQMRSLFAGAILMSTSLGMLLLLVLEKWLRGGSYVGWLLLTLLLFLALLSVSLTIMTRIR